MIIIILEAGATAFQAYCDAVQGAKDAVMENVTWGATEPLTEPFQPNTFAYKSGKVIGDVASALIGGAEIAGGVTVIKSAGSLNDDVRKLVEKSEKKSSKVEGGSGNSEGASKTVDDIIQGAKETTNGKGVAKNFEKSGGYSQAVKDFENLNPTNVKEIQTKYGTGYVGTLSDGTTVVVRQGSTTGGSTLEIKISNSKIYKVRY